MARGKPAEDRFAASTRALAAHAAGLARALLGRVRAHEAFVTAAMDPLADRLERLEGELVRMRAAMARMEENMAKRSLWVGPARTRATDGPYSAKKGPLGSEPAYEGTVLTRRILGRPGPVSPPIISWEEWGEKSEQLGPTEFAAWLEKRYLEATGGGAEAGGAADGGAALDAEPEGEGGETPGGAGGGEAPA